MSHEPNAASIAKGPAHYRQAFRWFWRWESRPRTRWPPVKGDLVGLIRRLWQANPTWGSRRSL
ncbi:MAG: hypothetical protein WBW41_06895 [Verrucomicrobiia bacterium]